MKLVDSVQESVPGRYVAKYV